MILGLALQHLWLDVGICWNQCYLPATCQQENHPGKPIYNFSIGHSRGWPNKSPSPDWAAYTRGHHQKLVDVMNIQAWPMDFLRISARQINPLTWAGCHTTSETWQSSKIRHNIQETSARHGFWWFLGWNFHVKLHWSGEASHDQKSQLSSRSTQGGNSSMCLGEQNEAGISGGFEKDKRFMIYIKLFFYIIGSYIYMYMYVYIYICICTHCSYIIINHMWHLSWALSDFQTKP